MLTAGFSVVDPHCMMRTYGPTEGLTQPLLSTASAAGKLQPPSKTSSLGTFKGVKYVQYEGLFAGKTSTGEYSVPYRISAPANLRSASHSTVLVEPPHFSQGMYLREGYLGRPFLFKSGFLHASVGYSTGSPPGFGGSISNRILDPAATGVFINGGVVLPGEKGRTDDEIIVDFASALSSDLVALALIGPVARRYLAGFSDSAEPVKRIVASGLAEDVFDMALPITTGSENDPQVSLGEGKYSGKVISVASDFEWYWGRALEDRKEKLDQYRYFIVAGTPHIPDPLCFFPLANMTTPAGWQPALRAHFLQGHDWVTQGEAPPTSTRLATTSGGAIARDSNRNALLVDITGASAPRLPFVELGEATFIVPIPGSTTPPRILLGTYSPPRTIEELGFSSSGEYLTAFEEALNAQVQAGYMLKKDAEVLLNRAKLFPPATFTQNYHDHYDDFGSGEYCP
jgi:Alpha/beta hydrolase domain